MDACYFRCRAVDFILPSGAENDGDRYHGDWSSRDGVVPNVLVLSSYNLIPKPTMPVLQSLAFLGSISKLDANCELVTVANRVAL